MSKNSVDVLNRAIIEAARSDLEIFTQLAFAELKGEPFLDNWHIGAVARKLERLESGDIKRLIISMPPRTMKSDMSSIFYPAWVLGRHPTQRIICVSYGQALSNDFASAMRNLMRSEVYAQVFPRTRLDPRRSSVEEMATTAGGFRISTSIGGTLTGRGADQIIIDDPLKASDADSEAERTRMHSWYRQTLVSRLNNPAQGRIAVISQRLHLDDLPGRLIEDGAWDELSLPLVEWDRRRIEVLPGRYFERCPSSEHLALIAA